tara:strand:+ start:76 stop:621 length:546 start_codon:yes stop_codon:yes gene_type:complete
MEIWKPIEDAPGYEVSSFGNVRSVDRVKLLPNRYGSYNERRFKGKPIASHAFPNGYVGVLLGRGKCKLVHRLVAAAFIEGNTQLQVNHKNGKRDDNRVENLEWVSCSDNHRHSYASLNRKAHVWTNQVEVDGQVFQSQNAAARHLGVHGASVASALIHGHKVRGQTVKLIKGESNHAARRT